MEHSLDKLVSLAEKVGGDAWPILVRSAYLNGWLDLGESWVWIGVAVLISRVLYMFDPEDEFDRGLTTALKYLTLTIGWAICVIGFWSSVRSAVFALIFPEGVALQKLL